MVLRGDDRQATLSSLATQGTQQQQPVIPSAAMKASAILFSKLGCPFGLLMTFYFEQAITTVFSYTVEGIVINRLLQLLNPPFWAPCKAPKT